MSLRLINLNIFWKPWWSGNDDLKNRIDRNNTRLFDIRLMEESLHKVDMVHILLFTTGLIHPKRPLLAHGQNDPQENIFTMVMHIILHSGPRQTWNKQITIFATLIQLPNLHIFDSRKGPRNLVLVAFDGVLAESSGEIWGNMLPSLGQQREGAKLGWDGTRSSNLALVGFGMFILGVLIWSLS